MTKFINKYFWHFIMALQILIGTCAALLMLSAVETKTISYKVSIGDKSFEGMSLNEAEEYISKDSMEIYKDKKLIISIDENNFTIPYTDFDVCVDKDKTLGELKRVISSSGMKELLVSPDKEFEIQPVITYNQGKLIKECELIFSSFEKEPVAVRYKLENEDIIYTPQIPGIKTNYGILKEKIDEYLSLDTGEPLRIETKTSPIFMEVISESSLDEKFTTIVSKVKISVDEELKEYVKRVAEELQGAVFKSGEEINLRNLLDFSQFSDSVQRDVLNRVATGIYQSALCIERVEKVNRIPAKQPVSYTQPGLEAVIEGENGNLVMKNSTGAPLMLLINVNRADVDFCMVSVKELKNGILIVQKMDEVPPSVITTVNENLSPSQTIIVSEGVPGFTSQVSRIIDNDREELYKDKYEPISKVIETGKKPIITSDK